jgi:hypothetical protein
MKASVASPVAQDNVVIRKSVLRFALGTKNLHPMFATAINLSDERVRI